MAELKKISSPNREGDGDGTTIEARFAHFCKVVPLIFTSSWSKIPLLDFLDLSLSVCC